LFAVFPLQSRDEGHAEDESIQRSSKSKSERSSKKKKKKVQHSPKTTPDEVGEPATEEDVSPPSFFI